MWRLLPLLLLIILPLAAGCATTATYRFRVVDAATGRPLEGVNPAVGWRGHYFGNRAFDDAEYRKLPRTGPDGLVTAERVVTGPSFDVRFYFKKGGYRALVLYGNTSEPGKDWAFRYRDSDTLPAATAEKAAAPVPSGELVEIPMRRLHGVEGAE